MSLRRTSARWCACVLALFTGGNGQGAYGQQPPIRASAAERFAASTDEAPNLRRHVVPLLTRLGCNAAACHGAKGGQGGFELSLFGYDYQHDLVELADEGDPPRANWRSPQESVVLHKPTLLESHEGGKRFDAAGWEYRLLLNWIAARAPGPTPLDDAASVRLELRPEAITIAELEQSVPLQVIAHWSDGLVEDVTPLCRFQTNDDAVAAVDQAGRIASSGYGDTHVVVFYDKAVAAAPVYVPRPPSDRPAATRPDALAPVDRFVQDKLDALNIEPSEICTDEEFLRRVRLDLTGSLPTANEVRQFLADASADKRAAKIDQLLQSPEYAAWWTTWICELTGNSEEVMPSPQFVHEESRQWYDWVYKRVKDNQPYDKLVEGMIVSESRRPGQSYQEYCAEMSSYVRTANPADFAQRETMPHFWSRRNVQGAANKTLAFTHVFLAVQIQCAECHKHPFDRWTKDDFDGLKRFFEPLAYGRPASAQSESRRLEAAIKVPKGHRANPYFAQHARNGGVIPWKELYYGQKTPQPIQAAAATPAPRAAPLHALMQWTRSLDHPYLAIAYVNRVWHHHLGRGIVDPPDDLSLANPPSNQPLLDYLTSEFIASGYDMAALHRTILTSRTYQRSWRTNATNRNDARNFSHACLRRIPAEALYDAIATATAANQDESLSARNRMTGPAAGMLRSDGRNRLLAPLGKPDRDAVCERQRSNEPNLSQALFLQNDPAVYAMIDRDDGWLAVNKTALLAADDRAVNKYVDEAYLRALGRFPAEDERAACRDFVAQSENPGHGLRGVLWALLNSKEFCLNH